MITKGPPRWRVFHVLSPHAKAAIVDRTNFYLGVDDGDMWREFRTAVKGHVTLTPRRSWAFGR
jgi:hypothetical protein